MYLKSYADWLFCYSNWVLQVFFYEFFYSLKKTLELSNEKGYTMFKQILE